jgi:hypothetical protein
MKRKAATLIAAASLACAPAIAGAAGNLLRNHSFELPLLIAGGYVSYDKTVHYWTYASAVLISATNPAAGGSPWWPSAPCPPGYLGSQFAGLESTTSLSQTFTVSTSGDFELRWLAGGRPASYGDQHNGDEIYEIEIDGTAVARPFSTTSSEPFTLQRLLLKELSAGVHTLTFQGLVSDSDETAFIDDVVLVSKKGM